MVDNTPYRAVTFSPQPSVAYFLRRILECAGVNVTAATFAVSDLETAVGRDRPDVIVSDVSFPFEENWQRLEVIRQGTLGAIPLVITSSEARELERAVGVSGVVEIFARPHDLTEVRAAVCRAVEGASTGA
jgi:CheY-like chemotaxis protein